MVTVWAPLFVLAYWLAVIFAAFGALAWLGQKIDERDENRR